MREPENELTEEKAEELIQEGFYKMETSSDSIQEQTINTLVINIYNIMGTASATNPEYFTNLNILIRLLAGRLKEKWAIKRLDQIFDNSAVNEDYSFPLAVLEYYYFRDIKWGYGLEKAYQNKQIKLSEIKMALMKIKREMLDIFTVVAIRHNIDVSAITPPSGVDMDMPDL
jgi:hypothetical protein